MLATWHFHIEISSKCTLKCPRCARQEVPDNLINTELKLDFFEKNFTETFVRDNLEKITFCGDDGDPIYAHDLIDVVSYFKKLKDIEIVIVTNGSYKSKSWWERLGSVMTEKDSVHFSIDGWDNESNNLYRKNSNYDSIIEGIKTLRLNSKCQIIWATILFKFNENQIDQIKSQASNLGVNRFQLTKSTKFGSVYPSYGADDILEPSKINVSRTYRFERTIENLTSFIDIVHPINVELYNQNKTHMDIIPLCNIGNKGLYIDSQGRLFPCCWVANRYQHNNEWQEIAQKFNLNNITLEQALDDNFWITDMKTYRWTECKTKCASSVVNFEYATSW
jgi:MoaA/NifB/PqqE/SkfB family radical SAM enzyme